VCGRVGRDAAACDAVLLRLAAETASTAALPTVEAAAKKYRLAFVPGLFSECFEQFARPFADVQGDLRAAGFTVDYFQVPGRGNAAQNADRLAERILAITDDPRPIIVFAYSKGLVDTLELVVRHPDAARRIAAIVAVAGAANGTPLADDVHDLYRDWGAEFPLPGCDKGNGTEMNDLRRDVRIAWWQQHADEVSVPVFALVAAPLPERVSPATRATYRWLARLDPRNDGKLLWQDQIPARSYLLGYVNADHWAIATPVAKELPAFRLLLRDDTPRTALIESAIEVVDWTLSEPAPR
jgi:hypothetical protein